MLLLTKGNSLEEVKWKVYSKGTFSLKLHFSIFSVWLLPSGRQLHKVILWNGQRKGGKPPIIEFFEKSTNSWTNLFGHGANLGHWLHNSEPRWREEMAGQKTLQTVHLN